MPGRRGGYALLGLSALLFAIGVGSGISGASRLTARQDDTSAVRAAAATFVETYGSFDFAAPDAYQARLAALSNGALREAITDASIVADARRLRRSTSTHIESVSVTALSGDAAAAHVVAVQQRHWVDPKSTAPHHANVRQQVALRLVFERGAWLVAELRLVVEEPAPEEGR